jgi:hypothetical protein
MTQRFTIDGSDDLESTLASYCEQARSGIIRIIPPRRIRALLLGGGYGRGEGGVLKTAVGDKPYNDLEFYVLLSGYDKINNKLFHHRVEELARELTSRFGVDTEFKLLALRKLERSSVSMFYYDLVTGHRLLQGEDSWLAGCDQHRAAHRIPLHEATRLLFNRCSGLLYSQERLERDVFNADDADFVGRNLAKAKLALGDVILALRREYHWSCRERHKRLRKLEADGSLQSFSSVLPLHAQGVEFKLHPVQMDRSPGEFLPELDFIKEIAARLWLTLEEARLGKSFADTCAYSFDPACKCPETRPIKNRLINARRFGATKILDQTYPRERLLRSLPLLLWSSQSIAEPRILSFLQKQLRTSAATYPELVRAYEALWRIYN